MNDAYAPSKRGGRVTKLCIFPGAANYDARKVHVPIFRGEYSTFQ